MSVVVEEAPAPRVAPQSPVLDDKTRDLLRRAKGLLAQGWCQGHARLGDSYCTVGALVWANDADRPSDGPYFDAKHALERLIGDRAIAQWNDAPGRTQDEVIDLFDRALGA